VFVDGALGLTSAANRFIFQPLGGFSRLAIQKFTRTSAFFKEFLAQLQ